MSGSKALVSLRLLLFIVSPFGLIGKPGKYLQKKKKKICRVPLVIPIIILRIKPTSITRDRLLSLLFIDPSEQNTIDKLIQKIQGTPMGGAIRRLIKRQLQKRKYIDDYVMKNCLHWS